MKELHASKASRLLAIADISADINGSIEFTRFSTKIDKPFVVYNPNADTYAYESALLSMRARLDILQLGGGWHSPRLGGQSAGRAAAWLQ
jgi:hypothetical protein